MGCMQQFFVKACLVKENRRGENVRIDKGFSC